MKPTSPASAEPSEPLITEHPSHPRTTKEAEDNIEASESNSESYSEEESKIERWRPLINALTTATQTAARSSPLYDKSNPAPFLTYWRSIFADLETTINADPSIPTFLTEPPCKEFEVKLFNEPDLGCCPCSHPDVQPSVVVRNDGGVTKGDSIRELCGLLYADDVPVVYLANAWDTEEKRAYDEHVLVYTCDWMSEGGSGDERRVYGEIPCIWIYGCPLGEFTRRVEETKKESVEEGVDEQKEGRKKMLERRPSKM